MINFINMTVKQQQ